MNKKLPLFAGIILLTTGIILKKSTDLNIAAITLMASGVAFKIYYIVSKIIRGEYKPGVELGILIVGLMLFFSGLYLRSHESIYNSSILIYGGISLKVIFIIVFIKKSRAYTSPD